MPQASTFTGMPPSDVTRIDDQECPMGAAEGARPPAVVRRRSGLCVNRHHRFDPDRTGPTGRVKPPAG